MDFYNKDSIGTEDRAYAELGHLNRQSIELLRLQAVSKSSVTQIRPMFVGLASLWEQLHPAAVLRAASCPCLLFDFAFLDTRGWRAVARDLVHDQERMPRFFDVSTADSVARAILTEVWHYSRMHGALLGLFGISNTVADIMAGCSQTQILLIAEQRGGWLQPRWPGRVWFWRNLLSAAIADDHAALDRVRFQAVAMLATEMRYAPR